jgi:tyrocidine synthetase-3
MMPVPLGVVGELYIGGDGVARGYLNRLELTAEKFISNSPVDGKRLYRTGDRARWLPDGNMEFLGRIDQQVKVRGFRIEPGEIENQLLRHGEIKEAVVIAVEDEVEDRYLCAYIVPSHSRSKETFNGFGLRDHLLTFLPDYMVPSYFIRIDELPLTPTGKIDRNVLPSPEIGLGEKYIAPRDEVEIRLADIWGEVLLLPVPIGIDDNFFQLGGHSLKAVALLAKIHKAFNVKLPVSEMFKRPSIRRLSVYIRGAIEERYRSIEAAEKKEYYALSSAQKRLYFLHQMQVDEAITVYNMSSAWVLEGVLDKVRLEQASRKLIQRHESLRTSFDRVEEEPVQKIHKFEEVKFEIQRLAGSMRFAHCDLRLSDLIENFIRPFDLSNALLMRVGLIRLEEKKHILLFDMHHIISDGISVGIFVREFMSLYPGKDLPRLKTRYRDFTQWQNRQLQSTAVKQQENYWLKEMADEIPVLELPFDYPRAVVKQTEGRNLPFEIGQEKTEQLKQLTLETETTFFMVLLAIFNILLSTLSNQDDIIVGSPIAGRSHHSLENIIGVFINTLALRNFPSAEKRFSEFLTEVKGTCLKAFENQDYQYEELVEKVVTNRDLSRNSLFDVMLVLHNMEIQQLEIPGLKLIPYDYESCTSKFDITLTAVEKKDGFDFSITYCTALFKEDTIQRFIDYFRRILDVVLEDRKRRISKIDILPDDEKNQLLYGFKNHPPAI